MSLTVRVSTFVALLIGFSACGGGEDGPEPLAVEDMLGRKCQITIEDEVSCDEPPMPSTACNAGETACFQVGTTGNAAGPGAICAACCSQNTSRSVAGDCVNLVCATAEDCPAVYGRCVNSVCRH